MKVRTYMLKRFKDLARSRKVLAIKPFEDRFDVQLEGNLTVRLTAFELAAADVKVSA